MMSSSFRWTLFSAFVIFPAFAFGGNCGIWQCATGSWCCKETFIVTADYCSDSYTDASCKFFLFQDVVSLSLGAIIGIGSACLVAVAVTIVTCCCCCFNPGCPLRQCISPPAAAQVHVATNPL